MTRDICPCDGGGVIEPESDPDEPRPRRKPLICRSCGFGWGRYVRPEYFPTATSERQEAEQ
jgi:hypothetical protein